MREIDVSHRTPYRKNAQWCDVKIIKMLRSPRNTVDLGSDVFGRYFADDTQAGGSPVRSVGLNCNHVHRRVHSCCP